MDSHHFPSIPERFCSSFQLELSAKASRSSFPLEFSASRMSAKQRRGSQPNHRKPRPGNTAPPKYAVGQPYQYERDGPPVWLRGLRLPWWWPRNPNTHEPLQYLYRAMRPDLDELAIPRGSPKRPKLGDVPLDPIKRAQVAFRDVLGVRPP